MMREIDEAVCAVCGAGEPCSECLGAKKDPRFPGQSCQGCGGTGVEPPMLPTCSEERCGVPGLPVRP